MWFTPSTVVLLADDAARLTLVDVQASEYGGVQVACRSSIRLASRCHTTNSCGRKYAAYVLILEELCERLAIGAEGVGNVAVNDWSTVCIELLYIGLRTCRDYFLGA